MGDVFHFSLFVLVLFVILGILYKIEYRGRRKYDKGCWTWLGLFNFIIVQWMFFRVARVVEQGTYKTIGYTTLNWIVPLTGWWSNYKYCWR